QKYTSLTCSVHTKSASVVSSDSVSTSTDNFSPDLRVWVPHLGRDFQKSAASKGSAHLNKDRIQHPAAPTAP
uniref:Uncharacterized protein n=1 Tax=Chelydra serpentina TaxID=8475 RepID=A0A8C3RPR5_CHESE